MGVAGIEPTRRLSQIVTGPRFRVMTYIYDGNTTNLRTQSLKRREDNPHHLQVHTTLHDMRVLDHGPPSSTIRVWQGFCIVLMLTAASVFGLILGQLQETFAVANQRAREMEDHIDSIFTFLQENKLAAHTSRSAYFTTLRLL